MRRLLPLLIPVLVAIAAHLPSLRHDFLIWDDRAYVTQNPLIGTANELSLGVLLDPRTRTLSSWSPTALLTFKAEASLGGLDPHLFHGTNLALHALTALLVALLLRGLGLGPVGVATGAALYAAHPLQVEVVAWVSARKDLLAAVLALGSVLCYRRGGRYAAAGSFALFAVALGAKASAVVVPVLLLGLHWAERRRPSRSDWGWIAGMGVLSIMRGLLEIASQAAATADTAALGTVQRLACTVGVLGRYIRRWLVPSDLLAAYPIEPVDAWTGVTALLLIIGAIGAVWVARDRPILRAGLVWWPICLLPVLNVVPAPYLEADRYQYLALVAPALWIGFGFEQLARHREKLALALVATALLVLSILSWAEHRVWRSTEAFLEAQLQRNPEWWTGRLLRAVWHLEAGRLGPAEADVVVVRNAVPGFARTPHVLGLIAEKKGELDRASALHEEALRLDSAMTPAWAQLCSTRAMQGQAAVAIPACRTALAHDPYQPGVRRTLALMSVAMGNAADEAGKLEEALLRYGEALGADPDLPEAHYNLAVTLHRAGRLDEAVAHYQRTVAARPDDVDALTNQATAMRLLGRLQGARAAYARALQLDPTRAEAQYGLALLLATAGDLDGARRELNRLLNARPDLEEARRTLKQIEGALAEATGTSGEIP